MAKRGPKTKTARTTRKAAGTSVGWPVPDHLTGEAAAAWRHVVGLVHAAGNLDRTDPTLIEAYAINVQILRSAQQQIERDGLTTVNGAGAPVLHPACSAINAATMRLKAIINDLGLCPASSKYAASVSPDAQEKDSKWDGLLGVVG